MSLAKDLSEAHLGGVDLPAYLEELKCASVTVSTPDEEKTPPWQAISDLQDEPDGVALEGALRALRSACSDLDVIARTSAADQAQRLLKDRHVTAPAERVRAALGQASESGSEETAGAALESVLSDPEPWPEEVDGAQLLDDLHKTLHRHLVMSDDQAVAGALWALYAHCFDAFEVAPLLCVTSPVKRCAKTRLAELMARLVPAPLPIANLTPAAAFRAIEKYRPTLLFDEADRSLKDNPELNGILNAGHTRDSAHVMRCVGDEAEPRLFSVWAPKLVAGIGRQAGTLEDRSIVIELQRKRPEQKVAPLRQRNKAALEPLRRRAARWAADHLDELALADPEVPSLGGNDRAADNWYPLLAVADEAGGEWPLRARAAAERLTTGEVTQEGDGYGVLLLADLRDLFAERQADKLWTAEILGALNGGEERPWAHYRRGNPLDSNTMVRLLKPFGVRPDELRVADKTGRGYELDDCQEAFSRYIPALQPETPETDLQKAGFRGETPEPRVSPEKVPICSSVSPVSPREGNAQPQLRCEVASQTRAAAPGNDDDGMADGHQAATQSPGDTTAALLAVAALVARQRDASPAFLADHLDLYPAEVESVLDALTAAGIVGRSSRGSRPVLAEVADVDRLVDEYLLRVADRP